MPYDNYPGIKPFPPFEHLLFGEQRYLIAPDMEDNDLQENIDINDDMQPNPRRHRIIFDNNFDE